MAGASEAGGARQVIYAGPGSELVRFDIDLDSGKLTRREAVGLPANVQYAWQHPSGKFLYVATSERSAVTRVTGSAHFLCALSIEPGTGRLALLGEPVRLPLRPVHMSVDNEGRHAIVAYSEPAGVGVFRIEADGRLGAEVPPSAPLDVAIYPHQIRAMPSGRTVILVSRGNRPKEGRGEEPGSLNLFGYRDGVLSPKARIAPNGGYGFGPRHLDFHPTRPWVYVAIELQSQLQMYAVKDDLLSEAPLFTVGTLADPANKVPRQIVGGIRIHPNGRFVYVVNRADATTDVDGRAVFAGGENSIAVFSIDQDTGEPKLIQVADSHGIHVRNIVLDPDGRVLVAGNIHRRTVRDGAGFREVAPNIATFRVGGDGKLTFLAKEDLPDRDLMFWMGMAQVP